MTVWKSGRQREAIEIAAITKFLEMKLAILEFVDFNFNALPLDPRITFARVSAGTYFDADGVMQTAAINVPRIDHDPATGAVRGLLVEEQRTNLLAHSSDFSSAYWSKSNSSIVSGVVSPDGTATAFKLQEAADVNSTHQMSVPTGSRPTIGVAGVYTHSVYVQSAGRNRFGIYNNGSSGATGALFDFSSGRVAFAGAAFVAADLEQVADEWFRAWLCFNASAGTTALTVWLARDIATSGGGLDFYDGDGVSGVNLWHAQTEAGASPSSAILTTGAAQTRAESSSLVSALSDIRLDPTVGTFLIEHDAPSTRPLLSSGANLLATSEGAGKLAVAYDGTGTTRAHNGTISGTGAGLSFDTALRIGASATAHANACIKRIRYYPRRLSNAELQAITS